MSSRPSAIANHGLFELELDFEWSGWKTVMTGGIGLHDVLGVADPCITYDSPHSERR